MHHHARIDRRQHSALGLRHAQLRIDHRIGMQRAVHRREQRVNALARLRGNHYFAARLQAIALMRAQQIDFVQHFNARLAQRLKLAQHLLHLCLLLVAIGRRGVSHMQQHLGLLHFLERGAKAGDQRMRKGCG